MRKEIFVVNHGRQSIQSCIHSSVFHGRVRDGEAISLVSSG